MNNQKMNVHEGHRARLREKAHKGGTENMPDHELLEILLYNTNTRCDTNPIAHRLLDEFGSIVNIFDAKKESLLKVEGIGKESAVLLKAVKEIITRYNVGKMKVSENLDTFEKVKKFIISKFVNLTEERFYVICLNNNYKYIDGKFLSDAGTPTESIFYTRDVAHYVLNVNAVHVILAHNHPSGEIYPSYDDIRMTRSLKNILAPLGVRVDDHIIVGQDDAYSMKHDMHCDVFDE